MSSVPKVSRVCSGYLGDGGIFTFTAQHHIELQLTPLKVKFTSPFGTAQYPHLSTPDTQGKFATGKYSTKLQLPLGDPNAQALMKLIDDTAEQAHGKDGLKPTMHRPYKADEEANTVTFSFKSQYAPAIFDATNNVIPSSTRVGGGSVLRVMGVLVSFEKGISAQLNQVQVRELNGPGVSAFDTVEDGYSYAGTEPEAVATESAPNASLDI